MDAFCAEGHQGRLAFINGIRADESLVRFRSVANKINECYISGSSAPNVKLCKPIYDWKVQDIFKYFHDKAIRYCPIYDAQMWNNQPLRVATPLHAECAKRLDKIKTLYPVFWQQLIDIFPEIQVQERYWKDFDSFGVIAPYEHSWAGIIRYIQENLPDPEMRKKAITRVKRARTTRENRMKSGEGLHNLGGYPLLVRLQAGDFWRVQAGASTLRLSVPGGFRL